MLEYQIKVLGYAAERNLYRPEVVGVRNYGLQTETTKRDEYSPDTTRTKQKEEKKKKKKDVAAFPESPEEIEEIILREAPFRIAGLFKAISKAMMPRSPPPAGRRGVTVPLEYWDIELDDFKLLAVHRTQFLQLHGNIGARGSTLEYGDAADFTATLKIWTPALDYKDTEPLIKKIIRLSRLSGFGPFRHARLYFLNGEAPA